MSKPRSSRPKRAPEPHAKPVPEPAQLDWSDRAAAAKWWAALCEAYEDVASVADDATRPPGERDLGRRMARKLYRDADRTVRSLLSHGEPASAKPGG